MVLVQPLAAQDRTTLPELKDLIPDSAVANPEAWAKQGVPPEAVSSPNAEPDVQPDTPLADMPQVTVPWPDKLQLPDLAPLTPEPDIQFAEPERPAQRVRQGDEVRLSSELLLVFPSDDARFPERDEGGREKPYEKFPWDGVSGVRPFAELASSTVVGVY